MNDELIFVKTASGEDAVRDRTRLVQRNLRMVLILVDGLTDVGVLKQKAGDPVMIETALSELERIGLIESLQARGTRQADSVVEVFASAEPSVSPEVEHYLDYPTVDTVFDDQMAVQQQSTEDIRPAVEDSPLRTSHEAAPVSEGWFARTIHHWSQVREERAYERAYGKPSEGRILPRKRKLKMKKIIAVVLLGILIVVAARIVFYPYDEYRPEFEARIGRMLAVDEVKIGSVRLALTPEPRLLLERIVIGNDSDATIDSISMLPDPAFLIGGRLFRDARVTGLNARESFVERMAQWFPAGSIDDLMLDQMSVDALSVNLGWATLRGLSGIMKIVPNGGGATFAGKTGQGAVQFEVSPLSKGVRIAAKAGQWTIPVSPALAVAGLDFSGTLLPGLLTVEKVEARAFDGLLAGKGSISWQSTPRMVLDMDLKRLNAERLLEALGAPALLAGELGGQAQLVADAPSVDWLNKGTRLDGSISVAHGSVKRIDLAGALRQSGGDNASRRGGDTGFEDFTAKVSVDAASVRLAGVRLSSGLMVASGQSVASRQTGSISGVANVELRGSVNARRATIAISGSARNPDAKVAP